MQNILPSLHMLEIFMPLAAHEDFFTGLLEDVRKIPFYQGIEFPVIFKQENQQTVRRIVEEEDYQLTVWSSPNISDSGCNLSSLDSQLRDKSVALAIELIHIAALMGATNVGVPCGPDPGDADRPAALEALYESYCRMSEAASQYQGLHLTFEPLDRYAHKKQILGPMREVIPWFARLREACPNFYLHWDSAHEALGGIDLMESLELALPFMAQFHICNCVTDPTHPCYGDWHMELGPAPEYQNWGYLNVDIAAGFLRRAASADKVDGVKNTHVAVEVRTHLGDDFWKRESEIRQFLMAAYDRAGLTYRT